MSICKQLGLAIGLSVAICGVSQAAISYSSNPSGTGVYATTPTIDPFLVDLGSGQATNLGNDGAHTGDFDKLLLSGVAGSIPGDGLYALNDFTFDVGINRNNAAGPFSYTFTQDLTIGGVTHQITVPFSLSISNSDTLIFATGSSVFYDLGLVTLTATAVAGGPYVNGGGSQLGTVMFQVSGVPEPSTVALIAVALMSMFGFGMMRRRAEG